nr:hypothetical protein [uncultured Methanobacterium sp.]
MKRKTITVDEAVDLKFRKKASQIYHFEKGWYSKAVADAMKDWASESKALSTDVNDLMNNINPDSWETLKSELNMGDNDLFENMEDFINYINNESNYDLKIDREGDNITVKLENNIDSTINNPESNLKTLMMLHLVLKIILFSLEEATKNKYVISGIGAIPPVYINKIKNDQTDK